MKFTASVMAAIEKVVAPVLGRPPSAGPLNGVKAQARGLQSNSSPVYKTQSETLLQPKPPNVLDRGINRARRLSTGVGMKPVKTLEDVSDLLKCETVKNVVVLAGAGISTPSGIPDFRTPGTGLYDNLQQYRIPYPEAIFDIDYFHHNPKPFFTLAKELYPSGKYRPNYIHYFLRLLHDKGMLLRMYTQNIDGLERLAGLPQEKLVEAHGTFASATCTICGCPKEGSEVKESIFKDRLPKCNKRGCPGILKPDIVFFGEDLPQRFYLYLRDMLQTDLVIVMGTSLEVQPFAGIIDTVKYGVPRVLFNWNAVGPFKYGKRSHDVVGTGDLITSTQKFVEMTGWKSEMEELIIQNEGSLLICSPQYKKQLANKAKQKPSRPDPIVNSYWRNQTAESSSEESTDSETDSDSDSSSDENKRYKSESFRRRGARSTGSMKNNMGTATIKNGTRSNGLLKDIKKNGPENGNGQKRDFSTRISSMRSPAPNSISRQDKFMGGRNSVAATRPPSGKISSGKISPTKPLSEKISPTKPLSEKIKTEKLSPLSNRVKLEQNEMPTYSDVVKSGNKTASENIKSEAKIIPSNNTEISVRTENKTLSENVKSEVNNIPTDVSENVKSEVNNIPTENIETPVNLSDTSIPSLDRVVTSSERTTDTQVNIVTSAEASIDDNKKSTVNEEIASSNNENSESTNHQHDVDCVKEGIEKITLKECAVDKTLNSSVFQETVENIVNNVSSSKKNLLPSDVLLSTRSEQNSSNKTNTLSENSKKSKTLLNTIKSESALSTLTSRQKYLKGSLSAGSKVDISAKSGKSKRSERMKRSTSEKNLRKKEKSEKTRSISAKAKVNLRLIHNRYAKRANIDPASAEESGGYNNQNATLSDINDQPYVDLRGTLKREKPLDFGQNMSERLNDSERPVSQNKDVKIPESSEFIKESANVETISERLSSMSMQTPLPEEDEVCSDSEKPNEGRRKKFHRKPPKPKKKLQDLNTLNPVPYGYAKPRYQRLTNRAMIPANVCSGYEFPSEYVSPELIQRLSSQNGVKLAYRHSLKSSSPVSSKVIVREDSTQSEIIEKAVDIC